MFASEALFVAIDVYVVIVALMAFRLFFNYVRWIVPKVEGPGRAHGAVGLHKVFAGVIVSTVLGLIVRTVLRLFGFAN